VHNQLFVCNRLYDSNYHQLKRQIKDSKAIADLCGGTSEVRYVFYLNT